MTLIPRRRRQARVPPSCSRSRALARLKKPGMHLSDREFLAPALEILETPPSPVHVAFLWIICAFVAARWLGPISGASTSSPPRKASFSRPDRSRSSSRWRPARSRPFSSATARSCSAGDVLVELDRSAAAGRRERRARGACLCAGGNPAPQDRAFERAVASPSIRRRRSIGPRERAPALRERETRVLAADLGQLAANVAAFDAERAQKTAERDKLRATIATQKNLVATLQERVDMRTKLVEVKAGAKAAVIDATETLQYQITQEAKQEQDLVS